VTELVQHPSGAFAYLPGSSTFSNGLVVSSGHRLTEWELAEPLPLRAAFDRIGAELEARGFGWESLAGVDLRSPSPFAPQGFAEFNAAYTALLGEYYPLADGDLAPYARTNVAPVERYVTEPCVRAVQIVEPHPGAEGDFVASGVAEIIKAPTPADTIAFGDTSPAGLRAKVDFVVATLAGRVADLGLPISAANTIDAYTAHPLDWLEAVVGATFVAVGRFGMHRWIARPPVTDLEFEMGCKRISTRLTLATAVS
jgi:hypothetical protein